MTSVVTSQRAVHFSKMFGETQFGLLSHMFAEVTIKTGWICIILNLSFTLKSFLMSS